MIPVSSRFFLVWVLACLLEALAVWFSMPFWYASESFHVLLQAFLAHVAAGIVLYLSEGKGRGWFHHTRSWPMVMVLWHFFLPVLGLVAGLVYRLSTHQDSSPNLLVEDIFFEGSKRTHQNDLQEPLLTTTRIAQELSLHPLSDIMVDQDLVLKRGAIEKLTLLGTPDAIETLLQYRSDPSPEVRFYVTSSLTRLKKNFQDQLEAARVEMKKDVSRLSVRILLARLYFQYVGTGLLDVMTAKKYFAESLYHLEYILTHIDSPAPGSADEHYFTEASRLLLDFLQYLLKNSALMDTAGHKEKIRAMIAGMRQKELLPKSDIIKLKILFHYHWKEFAQVAQCFDSLAKEGTVEPEWLAALHWWRGAA